MATAVALGFLWALSGFFERIPFPPTALAEAMIRATPGDVATFVIEALKGWARRLLSISAVLVTLALGAEMLVLTLRGARPRPRVAGGILALVGWLAVIPTPDRARSLLLMAAGLAIAAAIYAGVASVVMAERAAAKAGEEEVDLGRRRVLRMSAGTATVIALGGGLLGYFARKLGGPDRAVDLVAPTSPARLPERGAWPDIPGLSPEVTSPSDHYVVDINLVQPSVETQGWVLGVGGEVATPLRLSFGELQERFDIVEEYSVLTCISNEVGGGLVGNSRWAGVRLGDVLEAAGARAASSGPADVVFRAADGYSDSITLETATDQAVLLAVAQNGAPLTQEHGFPCRVRVPSTYGMKNVKWIESIEVVHRDYRGYWMQRGWSDLALVKTESRIDIVGEGSGRARAGVRTWIAGVAWAGDRGISKVEVSTDDGATWMQARLKEEINSQTWRLWAHRWTPQSAGRTGVLCRATDGAGRLQTRGVAAPHPSGATGYHRLEIEIT